MQWIDFRSLCYCGLIDRCVTDGEAYWALYVANATVVQMCDDCHSLV